MSYFCIFCSYPRLRGTDEHSSISSSITAYQILTCAAPRMPLAAPPPLTTTLPPLIPPNYIENGRLYHGFRKGRYMFPCDEVNFLDFPDFQQPFSTRGTVLIVGGFTARNGSHGYLSQVLLSCKARNVTFDTFHAQLRSRATDLGSGNGDRNMGDRYGRVSNPNSQFALMRYREKLQSADIWAHSKYPDAEIRGIDLAWIQPATYVQKAPFSKTLEADSLRLQDSSQPDLYATRL
jgi:hypothetical protein